MGQRYSGISDKLRFFIEAQKIYFVGTATADGRVNVSPKGMDSLKVLGGNRVVWLNVTGSGNETAAHIQERKEPDKFGWKANQYRYEKYKIKTTGTD